MSKGKKWLGIRKSKSVGNLNRETYILNEFEKRAIRLLYCIPISEIRFQDVVDGLRKNQHTHCWDRLNPEDIELMLGLFRRIINNKSQTLDRYCEYFKVTPKDMIHLTNRACESAKRYLRRWLKYNQQAEHQHFGIVSDLNQTLNSSYEITPSIQLSVTGTIDLIIDGELMTTVKFMRSSQNGMLQMGWVNYHVWIIFLNSCHRRNISRVLVKYGKTSIWKSLKDIDVRLRVAPDLCSLVFHGPKTKLRLSEIRGAWVLNRDAVYKIRKELTFEKSDTNPWTIGVFVPGYISKQYFLTARIPEELFCGSGLVVNGRILGVLATKVMDKAIYGFHPLPLN